MAGQRTIKHLTSCSYKIKIKYNDNKGGFERKVNVYENDTKGTFCLLIF